MKHKLIFVFCLVMASCSSLQKSGLINARGDDYLQAEVKERKPTAFMPKYNTLYDIPYIKSFSSNTPSPIEYPQLSLIPSKSKDTYLKSKISIASGESVLGEPMLKIRAPLAMSFDATTAALGTWYEVLNVERNEDYGKIITLTYETLPIKIKMSMQSNYSVILITTLDEDIYLLKDTATRDILRTFASIFRNNLAQEFNKLDKNKLY